MIHIQQDRFSHMHPLRECSKRPGAVSKPPLRYRAPGHRESFRGRFDARVMLGRIGLVDYLCGRLGLAVRRTAPCNFSHATLPSLLANAQCVGRSVISIVTTSIQAPQRER